MENKKCGKCGLNKTLDGFYLRKKGARAGQYYDRCKECFLQRGRRYYHENHDRQLSLALIRKKRYIQEREKWVNKIKDKPCSDCGLKFPSYVMDFDHTGSGTKIASISILIRRNTSNIKKIREEIKKCDLVCSNCHRIRTYARIQKQKAEVANVVKALV